VIALFVFVILGGFGFALFKQLSQKPSPQIAGNNNQKEQGAALDASLTLKDTDQDGLKDWEEALWKTNPKNPDTDGDGTGDGNEVRAGRNPLVKGPKDVLATAAAPKITGADNRTTTQKIAEDIFGNYLTLKQSGVTLDSQQSGAIVNAALKGVSTYSAAKKYILTDIHISRDESPAALRTYGNALGDIINKYGKPNVDNELIIVQNALQTNDSKKLSDLKIILDSYKKVIDALAKVSTPASAASAHLSLLNSASSVSATIAAMQSLFSDPIVALAGLRDYQTQAGNLAVALDTLNIYFENRRISFASSEPAATFFAFANQ